MKQIFLIAVLLGLITCQNQEEEQVITPTTPVVDKTPNLLTDYTAFSGDGNVNAVIEIPAGSVEKWELNKSTGKMERDSVDNQPRTINYLGYPANYGLIPRTILPKDKGGDGDPLDIIVIGGPQERGTVISTKVLGVLRLLDRGEQDDKIIAVSSESTLYHVNSLTDLDENYPGITQSLELWFVNYKGPGKMTSTGFGPKEAALEMISNANAAFESKVNDSEY